MEWQEDKGRNVWHGSEKQNNEGHRQYGYQNKQPLMWQDRSMSQNTRDNKTPMVGLQRPKCVNWRAWQGTQPSRMLKASSISRGASAKEASKRPRFGSTWLDTSNGRWRRKGKGSGCGSRLIKTKVVSIKCTVFLWADNYWVMSPSQKQLGQMGGRDMGSGTQASKPVVVEYICG